MNITFMVGNGFDLNIGLNTTFKNFISVYSREQSGDSEVIKKFKGDIKSELDKWSDAELRMGQYTDDFDGILKTAEQFCDCHEDFCEKLGSYLIEEEKFANLQDEKIVSSFLDAIFNIDRGFREEQKLAILECINANGGGLNYNFISFNYTETLDKCVSQVRHRAGSRNYNGYTHANAIQSVVHIHGYTNRDMVLGVNDKEQIKNIMLFDDAPQEYLDEIIKIQTNHANEERMDQKVYKILKESNLIYIYGMSIGATDALWWERVCELMKSRKDLQLIVHAFDAPKETLIRRRYITFEKNRKHDITKFSKLDQAEREDIEKRIHVTGYNLFDKLNSLSIPHKPGEKIEVENELLLTK